jgi:hypothetical protein
MTIRKTCLSLSGQSFAGSFLQPVVQRPGSSRWFRSLAKRHRAEFGEPGRWRAARLLSAGVAASLAAVVLQPALAGAAIGAVGQDTRRSELSSQTADGASPQRLSRMADRPMLQLVDYHGNYHGGYPNGYHGGYPNGYHGGYPRYSEGQWRGGAWRHDWHGGQYGWWWTIGPNWYAFPAPVYPYPTYPTYPPVMQAVPVSPPAVVVAPPPPPLATGQPPTQFWYFCDTSHAYYPYVSDCNVPWREVPATAAK